jgi:PAS domain S-box-containing protein
MDLVRNNNLPSTDLPAWILGSPLLRNVNISGFSLSSGRQGTSQPTSRGTILLVNDSTDQLVLMSRLLQNSWYRTVVAHDGSKAYSVLLTERPDLVISDISMPGIDGFELCRKIRNHSEFRLTPVLLFTAVCKDRDAVVNALAAGADDYVETPHDPIVFLAKISRLVERGRAQQVLQTNEERYRDVVENARDLIYYHDLQGNYRAVNQAVETITGYSRDEALRMNITDTVAPDDLERARHMIARKLAGEKITAYRLKIVAKDGRQIAVEVNTRLVRRKGKVIGVQGIARDVTERLHIEEQLRQAQKMEAVGQLAGGIAHDFNNLLTVITGYSELALRRLPVEDTLRHHVAEIKKAGVRAATLTRQLLAFSRKQVLQPKVIDLNSIVANMGEMMRRLIGEDVELRTVLAPELGSTKADPGQIEQVIMNLVVNARDAMPHGGNLIIETENVYLNESYTESHISVRPGAYVMLAVSDTGEGISTENKEHIFEPFFTTKETGRGTGLGLSTVYGIVKQSGGNIWVYSEVGQGTVFKVYLPRVDEVPQEYTRRGDVAETLHGNETVLVAEDDQRVRSLVREVLEHYGYRVLAAERGDIALQLAQQCDGPIDLLLTDVVMPKMSGRTVADQLRTIHPELKVLYMSGYTDESIVHHGVLDPNTPFLQKPFTPQVLARKVRGVLLNRGE